MIIDEISKTLRAVAMAILLGATCAALPAHAQLVNEAPKVTPAPPPESAPADGTKPVTAPPMPAKPALKAGSQPPHGTHNVQDVPTPPVTPVERAMHKIDDGIGHAQAALAPILPVLLIGARMGLLLLVLIGYVVFHVLRQRRQAVEAEQNRSLSEAEREFGRDADWSARHSKED
ncbi:MAG TPA: hypothetical protein V6C81_10775 [Planktothrix sp.]|jgi:hypothetical protein